MVMVDFSEVRCPGTGLATTSGHQIKFGFESTKRLLKITTVNLIEVSRLRVVDVEVYLEMAKNR